MENKSKEKRNITDSPWFYRLMALLFTLLLFFNANAQLRPSSTSTGQTYDASLQNIPVELKYDESEYFVSGYQESVLVSLSSINKILLDMESNEQTRKFSVVADLTDFGEGTYEVPLSVQNLNSAINATLEPATIHVTIEKRVNKSFEVTADTAGIQLEDDYQLESVELSKDSVNIETGENTLMEIHHVSAVIISDGKISDTTVIEAPIQIFNESGELLSGVVTPETVKATIKVIAPTKEVSISSIQTGSMISGVRGFEFINTPDKIVISGKKSLLHDIKTIQTQVDVTGVTSEKTVSVAPLLPDGITSETKAIRVVIKPILNGNQESPSSGGNNTTITTPSSSQKSSEESSEDKTTSESTKEE